MWSHDDDGEHLSEIGWMVLPPFQGRGLGKRAVRALLELSRDEERDIDFADRLLRATHWVINPRTDLT